MAANWSTLSCNLVRVHLPLQQGLRRGNPGHPPLHQGASASSITTRIKTTLAVERTEVSLGASASSITTRIKTKNLLE